MNAIFLATMNENKITELKFFLEKHGLHLETILHLKGFIALKETGTTIKENAYEKASIVFKLLGVPVMADDTGLSIDYLGGAPGVYSARFAGKNATAKQNTKKVLRILKGASEGKRKACFQTVICYIDQHGVQYFEGECRGRITTQEMGKMGFGYDSIFCPDNYPHTFAEMNLEEKNKISHRHQALDKFIQWYTNR